MVLILSKKRCYKISLNTFTTTNVSFTAYKCVELYTTQDNNKSVSYTNIPEISSKSLRKDTTFDNYILIMDAYSKLPRVYWMESITTEKVMEKLDIF